MAAGNAKYAEVYNHFGLPQLALEKQKNKMVLYSPNGFSTSLT